MAKVIIAGSREFNDYDFLKGKLDVILSTLDDIEIIEGGAKGVDSLAERYAKEKGYKHTKVEADWDTYGKYAGPKRNEEMASIGEYLVLCWNGKSKGSGSMLKEAKGKYLKIREIIIDI